MTEQRITSRKNPLLQQVKKLLSSKKAREEAGAYLENVRQAQENEPYAWLRELMDDGETT